MLNPLERQAIKKLVTTGIELRRTVRPNADLVDAMVAADVTLRTNYAHHVALRAFALFVKPR